MTSVRITLSIPAKCHMKMISIDRKTRYLG